MRKIFTLLFLLSILVLDINAQYRCTPSLQVPGYPGAYYSDPGEYYYWGGQIDSVTTWLPVDRLPFDFYFNGRLVSYYKVSTTGVLTFDTTVVAVPYFTHAALPSPLIPPQSICVTGIRASRIRVSNGGAAQVHYPQQFWITFANAYDSSLTHKTSWSIVLEDSTNNIYLENNYDVAAFGNPLAVGLQIDSTTAYSAPGSPNLVNPGNWTAGAPFYYVFTPGNNIISDGAVTSTTLPNFTATNYPLAINAWFKNLGSDTLTSLQLHYTINGGAPVSQSFSGLSLPTGNGQRFTFCLPWSPSTTGAYTFNIYCDNLSTGPDGDTTNNHFIQTIYVGDSLPPLKLLCEEFKGTWCHTSGYWADNYNTLLKANASRVSSIKYESSDNLTWNGSDCSARLGFYNINFVPAALINGTMAVDTSGGYYPAWPGSPTFVTPKSIDSFETLPGLFYVQPELYQLQNNYIQGAVIITSAFNIPAQHPCRVYTALVEDTIFRSGEHYNSDETLFVNTVRKLFPDGNGVLIGNPVKGHSDTINFVYQVADTSCNLARLHLVSFVQDMATKQVFQSAATPIVAYNLPVPPMPLITGDSMVCPGGHATMAAINLCEGCKYYWSNGDTGTTVSVSAAGLYTVSAVNNNGTVSSSAFKVSQISVPDLPVIAGNTYLCPRDGYQEFSIANPCQGCSYYVNGYLFYWGNRWYVDTVETDTIGVVNICGNNMAIFSITNAPPVTEPIISGAANFCPGSPDTLLVTNPCTGCSYVWSNHATGDTIAVTSAAIYTVNASNGCATLQSPNFSVASELPPTPLITGNDIICDGNSTTLSLSNPCNNCNYTWSNGLTTSQIIVDTAGVYILVAVNQCGSVSSITTVAAPGQAEVPVIAGNQELCPQQRGVLYVSNICAGCLYNWSTGQMGSAITFDSTGDYTVSVTNACNHTANAIYTVEWASLQQPQVLQTGNTLTAMDTGEVSYQWYMNDTMMLSGDTMQTFSLTGTAYYSVLVTNATGWSSMSASTLYEVSGLQAVSSNRIRIYPTVTTGNLIVDLGAGVHGIVNYIITDISGKKVFEGVIPVAASTYNINLNQLAAGAYIINLKNQNDPVSFKIIRIE